MECLICYGEFTPDEMVVCGNDRALCYPASSTAVCVETLYNISQTSTETNPLNGYLPRAETVSTDVMVGLCLRPMRTFAISNCRKG